MLYALQEMRMFIDPENSAFDQSLLKDMKGALTQLGRVLTIAPDNRKELDMSLSIIQMTLEHLSESSLMQCEAAQEFHAPFVKDVKAQVEDILVLKETGSIRAAMHALGHFMLERLEAGTPKVLH